MVSKGNIEMGFEKYIKRGDKIYCWNPETKKINKISIEEVDFKNCPEDILQDLMIVLDEARKAE